MVPAVLAIRAPVSRRVYIATGFALGILKYLVDAAVLYLDTGLWTSPLLYLIPVAQLRFSGAASDLGMTVLSVYVLGAYGAGLARAEGRSVVASFAVVPALTAAQGTTWYTVDMGPELYWTLWSDSLIHDIHRRVLEHIAAEAVAS
jgi:hypothetical protein